MDENVEEDGGEADDQSSTAVTESPDSQIECGQREIEMQTMGTTNNCDDRKSKDRSITEKTTFVVVESENTGYRFLCDEAECGKSFKRRHALNQHLAVHSGHRSVKCEMCGKSFFNSSQKYKHKESCHKSYLHHCGVCDKLFVNKHNLLTHSKSHKQMNNQHRCDVCDSTFAHKSDLTKHVRTHSTNSRSFSCDICNKEFAYKNSLRRHEKIHLNEKLHTCEKCDKKFIQKCDLLKHMSTHESPRFRCKECKQIFARKDSLIRHFKLHRPSLSCPVEECWDKFPSKASLLVHLRTDHNRLEVETVMTSLTFLDRPEEDEDHEAVDNPEPLADPGHDILVDIETQALENAGIFVDKSCLFNIEDDLDAELTTGQALVNESVLQSIQRDRELEEHNFVIAE